MMNSIGKSLVLIHVTLSLLALTWAAALLLQFIDWGWKEPRLDVNERVASEVDKRAAAITVAIRARNMELAPVKKSQEAMTAAMDRYAQNHLFYRNELERLKSAPGAIEVKDVKLVDGVLDLDVPRIGAPKLEQKIDGIDKSLVEYERLLYGKDALYKQIGDLEVELRDLTAKAEGITRQLNGVDEAGAKTVGLYTLLEDEAQMQARLRFEKEYIQPQWAEALERAQEFLERRERLEKTLERLKKDLSNPGKK